MSEIIPEVPLSEEEKLAIVRDFPDVVGHGPFDERCCPFGYSYRAGYQIIFLKRGDDIERITFHDKDLKFHWAGNNHRFELGGWKHLSFDTLYDAVKWFAETPRKERDWPLG